MEKIHDQCAQYRKNGDGNIDYIKGANIAGFVRVADAMLAEGHV
jgi:glutamate dehydrogenase (NADP+)